MESLCQIVSEEIKSLLGLNLTDLKLNDLVSMRNNALGILKNAGIETYSGSINEIVHIREASAKAIKEYFIK